MWQTNIIESHALKYSENIVWFGWTTTKIIVQILKSELIAFIVKLGGV